MVVMELMSQLCRYFYFWKKYDLMLWVIEIWWFNFNSLEWFEIPHQMSLGKYTLLALPVSYFKDVSVTYKLIW